MGTDTYIAVQTLIIDIHYLKPLASSLIDPLFKAVARAECRWRIVLYEQVEESVDPNHPHIFAEVQQWDVPTNK